MAIKRIKPEKDSIAESIQKSVMAYWEDRIDENGNKTGEQFKMRSIVFPSMLISMAQLVIGIAYSVLQNTGEEEPTVMDCLGLMRGSGDIFQDIQLFNSVSSFVDEWLEQSAITDDFDHAWFFWNDILESYQKHCEKQRSKTE